MAIDMATANGVNQIFTVFVENMEGKGFTQRKYWNNEEGTLKECLLLDMLNTGFVIYDSALEITDEGVEYINACFKTAYKMKDIQKIRQGVKGKGYLKACGLLEYFIGIDRAVGGDGTFFCLYIKALLIFVLGLIGTKSVRINEMVDFYKYLMAAKGVAEEVLQVDSIDYNVFEDVTCAQLDYIYTVIRLDESLGNTYRSIQKRLIERINGCEPDEKDAFDVEDGTGKCAPADNEHGDKDEDKEEGPDIDDEFPWDGNADEYDTNPDDRKDSVLMELESLVGLDDVKKQVRNILNLRIVGKKRDEFGIRRPPLSLNTVFMGNPGTGKTTVARIVGKIYREEGILPKGQLIEVSRADLVGKYVGHTAPLVKDAFKRAKGGILYIDEAYSLDSSDSFGNEAIEMLVKLMEDNREDTMVIVAGYPSLMREFLDSNPGLRSRFPYVLSFPDYSSDELVKIFKYYCDEYEISVSVPVLKKVDEYFMREVGTHSNHFGNARTVRNFFEEMLIKQANRLVKSGKLDRKGIKSFTLQDVPRKELVKSVSLPRAKISDFSNR